MNKIQIMILGKSVHDIAPIMQQLSATAEWQVNAFEDKEMAISHFVANDTDVVIFTETIDVETRNGLEKLFTFQQEEVIVLAGAADIWNRVNERLHELADSKRPQYAIVDDALKHAKFNISLN